MAKEGWQLLMHNGVARAVLDNVPKRPTKAESSEMIAILTDAAASIALKAGGFKDRPDGLLEAMSRAGFDAIVRVAEEYIAESN